MAGNKENFYLRFMRLLLPYRAQWIFILVLSVSGGLVSLALPYLAKIVVDDAIGGRNFRVFISLTAASGSVFCFGELINWLRYLLLRTVKFKVNFDLHRKVFRHLSGLSYGWFQERSTGEHMYTLGNDVDAVSDFVTEIMPQGLSIIPRAAFITVIIVYLNWQMALCVFLLAPLVYLPVRCFHLRMQAPYERLIVSSEAIVRRLQEIFSHILLVKVWSTEKKSCRRFLHVLIENIRNGIRCVRTEAASGFATDIASKFLVGLVGFYGGYLVINGRMSLGSLTAVMVYLTQLGSLGVQFATLWQTNISGSISCRRIADILDTPPEIVDAPGARDIEFALGAITLDGVGFGYRPGQFVLKKASLRINGGEHVALVGPSGAGKTTILNLLVRLYDPWEGRITIDGRDIKTCKIKSLKVQIGVALQDHALWDDSIANNIRYGSERVSRSEIADAGRLTGVDDFVQRLPNGYDTVIGENGCKLSDGQKQKIAIARSLVKKPKILILDEAMSSMDSESEARILANIRTSCDRLTVIVVSHRLSTVKACDRVLYLKAPNVIVSGTVESLIHEDPDFQKLFTGQI